MIKNKQEGKYHLFNENKDTYIQGICETGFFDFYKSCLEFIIEKF